MVNHLIVDFSGKNLANKRFIVNVVKRIAGITKMKILKGPIAVKGTKRPGVTCFAIIEESHISLHTFTDTNTANIDVFSCKAFDEKEVLSYIKKVFKAKILKIYSHSRII
jgi:S-adenosylmethionine decarboxylase